MLASPASKTPAQSPTKASSPPKNTHFVEPADEFDNSTQDRPDSVSILARTVDRNDKDNSPPPSNLPSDPPSHLPSDLPSDPPVEKTNLDIQLDNCNRRIDNANEEINTLYTQQVQDLQWHKCTVHYKQALRWGFDSQYVLFFF